VEPDVSQHPYRLPTWAATLIAFGSWFVAALLGGERLIWAAAFGGVFAALVYLFARRLRRLADGGDWDGANRQLLWTAGIPVALGVAAVVVLVIVATRL
jgi:hypothetical protein